jgi:hypothetical protein
MKIETLMAMDFTKAELVYGIDENGEVISSALELDRMLIDVDNEACCVDGELCWIVPPVALTVKQAKEEVERIRFVAKLVGQMLAQAEDDLRRRIQ